MATFGLTPRQREKYFTLNKRRTGFGNLLEDSATGAKDFVQFVTKPKEQVPLDTLFNVWSARNGKQIKENDNIKSVKNTQQKPKSAGLIQGGEPPKPSDEDSMWNNIMSASNHNTLGKSIKK